jgi:hypothetical protein
MKETVQPSVAWELGCADVKASCKDITPFDLAQERREIGHFDVDSEKRLIYLEYSKIGLPWDLRRVLPIKSKIDASLEGNEFLIEQLGVKLVKEVLKQKEILAEKMPLLYGKKGKDVVACGGEIFFGDTFIEAWKKAREKHGDRPFYSEKIKGIPEFPSVYSL